MPKYPQMRPQEKLCEKINLHKILLTILPRTCVLQCIHRMEPRADSAPPLYTFWRAGIPAHSQGKMSWTPTHSLCEQAQISAHREDQRSRPENKGLWLAESSGELWTGSRAAELNLGLIKSHGPTSCLIEQIENPLTLPIAYTAETAATHWQPMKYSIKTLLLAGKFGSQLSDKQLTFKAWNTSADMPRYPSDLFSTCASPNKVT